MSKDYNVFIIISSRGVVHGGPRFWQISYPYISKPWEADYAHQIILEHPDFQTFLRPSLETKIVLKCYGHIYLPKTRQNTYLTK